MGPEVSKLEVQHNLHICQPLHTEATNTDGFCANWCQGGTWQWITPFDVFQLVPFQCAHSNWATPKDGPYWSLLSPHFGWFACPQRPMKHVVCHHISMRSSRRTLPSWSTIARTKMFFGEPGGFMALAGVDIAFGRFGASPSRGRATALMA